MPDELPLQKIKMSETAPKFISLWRKKKSIKALFRHQLCAISFEAIWAVLPDMN